MQRETMQATDERKPTKLRSGVPSGQPGPSHWQPGDGPLTVGDSAVSEARAHVVVVVSQRAVALRVRWVDLAHVTRARDEELPCGRRDAQREVHGLHDTRDGCVHDKISCPRREKPGAEVINGTYHRRNQLDVRIGLHQIQLAIHESKQNTHQPTLGGSAATARHQPKRNVHSRTWQGRD